MSKIETQDHGKQNAAAWAGNISEMIAALECDFDRLEELRDERAALVDEVEESPNASPDSTAKQNLDHWDEENADELRELTTAATLEGDLQTDADSVRRRIEESPLSVQIRSGWVSPGDDMQAEEFEILLTTGGPALRIRGELDEHKQADRAWLEYQDWGTPWTQYFEVEQSTLLTFCQQFYFGD